VNSLLSRDERSYLIEKPSSLAGHRAPAALTPAQLDDFIRNLRDAGTELHWEEGRGFCLRWSQPHQPIIEARQIDLVRASYELLLRYFKANEITPATPESEEIVPCWHAWNITKALPFCREQGSVEEALQKQLFEEAPYISEETPLCFVDIETTGGSKLEDRVIQLAICRVEPTGEVQNYVSYFNPEGRPNKASFINQIPDWELKRAPLFKQELHHFMPLLSGAAFIAHNARRCDEPFLKEELRRAQASWPCVAVIDTLPISRRVWPQAPKHKLEVLAPWLGIHQGKIHDAQGDVETLMALWFAIREARPELTLSQLVGW
jgi:DNA polymerase III epsilon subunit-like protein